MPHGIRPVPRFAHTDAVRRALVLVVDQAAVADLLFLEAWEEQPVSSLPALLRMRQLRRAQPALAAEVRAEVTRRRQCPSGPPAGPAGPGHLP